MTPVLRAVTNGATLGAIEHPETWGADRIGRIVDHLVYGVVRLRRQK